MDSIPAADERLLLSINTHHSRALDIIFSAISVPGEMAALWVLIGVGLIAFGRGRGRITGLLLLLTLLLADQLVSRLLWTAVPRVRPYLALPAIRQLGPLHTGHSLPSGHAVSVCVAAVILGAEWTTLRWPLAAFALLTCYARVYSGMHYPTDVLAGALIGLACGFTALRLRRRLEARSASSPPPGRGVRQVS